MILRFDLIVAATLAALVSLGTIVALSVSVPNGQLEDGGFECYGPDGRNC